MNSNERNKMSEERVEGYWRKNLKDTDSPYPFPQAATLTVDEAKEVHAKIKLMEARATVVRYRGFSMSRFERTVIVGSAEYVYNGWRWPQGFNDHYVLRHRVRPTDDFLKFIGYL
jgi:hypothetical protein